eukprot:TRINITY_DN5705_c0_g1_i1.p1 TRINITY_DN5705_c0_g1~~TRINITY_DN5705_c0_g1_i1.p1  ORF type:complete len:237 (-),score=65.86 TRINITY_DN5705_c0_g1_i1:422-1051(-)
MALRSRSSATSILFSAAVVAFTCSRGLSFIAPARTASPAQAKVHEPAAVAGVAAMLAAAPMPAYAGGMFDFGLTLPFVAITFLAMMVTLNALWFAPVTAEVDERNAKLLQTLSEATDMLAQADEIQEKYTKEMREARAEAQQNFKQFKEGVVKDSNAKIDIATRKRNQEQLRLQKEFEDMVDARCRDAEPQIKTTKDEFVKKTLAEVGL